MPNTVHAVKSWRIWPKRRVAADALPMPTLNDTIYLIQDDETGLYFIWCYAHKAMAEYIASRVHPESETDRQANWRASRLTLSLSRRRRKE